MLCLGIVSLLQILSGGTGKIFFGRFAEPFVWTISYVDPDGKAVVTRRARLVGNEYSEGKTKGGSIRAEMQFRECQTFSRYGFWVGPYGADSTIRQPSQWTLSVRGAQRDWSKADSEQVSGGYANETWYNFPLRTNFGCIDGVRWDITGLASSNIFRLFQFHIYNPGLFSRLSGR